MADAKDARALVPQLQREVARHREGEQIEVLNAQVEQLAREKLDLERQLLAVLLQNGPDGVMVLEAALILAERPGLFHVERIQRPSGMVILRARRAEGV